MTDGAVFRCTFTVRFGDCDPAAIVFYPRYVEMLNNAVEEWFEKGLGLPWGKMHRTEHRGMPIVDLHVRFLKPSRLGEHLEFALALSSLGRSAIALEIVAEGGGERRLEARLKLVHSDLRGPKAVPIPPDLRERMKPFLVHIER
ncbi:MAG: acyl-CoA thioesterase [Alphaproteobacteria bacterium]|nr:acyl-CoA thioesterase [Alphaproteobacteria bacterium]